MAVTTSIPNPRMATAIRPPNASMARLAGRTPSGMSPKFIMNTLITRPRYLSSTTSRMRVWFRVRRVASPSPMSTIMAAPAM